MANVFLPWVAVVSGAAGAVMLASSTVYSEESYKTTPQQYVHQVKTKSLYDPPAEEWAIIDEPTELELSIRKVRLSVSNSLSSTRTHVDAVVQQWVEAERRSTDPNEKFLPGALYVTLGGFAGSIFGKNRNLALRILSPPTLAFGTFAYWYPHLTQNLFKDSVPGAKTVINWIETDGSNLLKRANSAWESTRDAIQGAIGGGDPGDGKEKGKDM
ncbi:apolipo protein O-domain-containing protein [Cladochytrium replicatum]|nr:apolipo protein O-domain-containing protein [Cladochytrium replicatum]